MRKTEFIEQRLSEYLHSVGVVSIDDVDEKQTEGIFLKAVRDFMDEAISLDDLSFVAGKLWWNAIEKEKSFSKEFLDILIAGEEMDFYVRRVLRPKLDTIFLSFLKDVLEFYEDKTKGRAEREE